MLPVVSSTTLFSFLYSVTLIFSYISWSALPTPSQYYMKNCEYVLFLRKGKAKWINDIGGSKTVHQFNNIIGKKTHPCEKPVDLLKFYIANSSNEDDIVFDPFSGTGSTLVAAKELNRQWLGYEIDGEYYNIAVNRLDKGGV